MPGKPHMATFFQLRGLGLVLPILVGLKPLEKFIRDIDNGNGDEYNENDYESGDK